MAQGFVASKGEGGGSKTLRPITLIGEGHIVPRLIALLARRRGSETQRPITSLCKGHVVLRPVALIYEEKRVRTPEDHIFN